MEISKMKTLLILTTTLIFEEGSFVSCRTDGPYEYKKFSASCSFFDFQQKLLEKLVRMEFRMEALEKHIERLEPDCIRKNVLFKELDERYVTFQMLRNVSETLETNNEKEQMRIDKDMEMYNSMLRSEAKKCESAEEQLSNLQVHFQQFIILQNRTTNQLNLESKRLKAEFGENFGRLEGSLNSLMISANRTNLNQEKINAEMSKQISQNMKLCEMDSSQTRKLVNNKTALLNVTLQNLLLQTPVVFKAYGLKDDSNMTGKTLQFPNIRLNEGGGYDPQTGIFTAPLPGIYIFIVQMCVEGHKTVKLYIDVVHGGRIGVLFYINEGKSFDCVTGDGVAKLQPGDKVRVVSVSGTSSGDALISGGDYSSFTGFLK